MKLRKQLIVWLFEMSQRVYTRYFKFNRPWGIGRKDLVRYPEESFGFALGSFLYSNGFDLIPKVERHDAYHVITGFTSRVQDEIALQYLCFGNGKRSLYLFGVVIVGTLLLPEYIRYYLRAFRIGTKAHPFHSLPFQKLLHISLNELRAIVFTSEIRHELEHFQARPDQLPIINT